MKNDPLSELLRDWRVDAPLPPAFQSNVWKRIAALGQPKPALARTFRNWLSDMLPRPVLAASYLAVVMFIGVGAGWGHARQESARVKGELGQRYLQTLDPYLSSHH